MRELLIAVGLIFVIEGLLFALFPNKMKNLVTFIETLSENNLRFVGISSALIGFLIVYFTN